LLEALASCPIFLVMKQSPSDALASSVRTDAAEPTVELRFRFRIAEFAPNQLILVMRDQCQ
jgi:hypothetical protein